MPRRIAEIELGLCFLIMFGTATIADDEVVFDLSEASIQQVAGRRRAARAGRYVESALYPMSSQYPSGQHAPHSPLSVQPGDPQFAHPQWGPGSGNFPPGSPQAGRPQSGDPQSGYLPSDPPQSGYPQSDGAEFAYPWGADSQFVHPQPESRAFGPVPVEDSGGLFSWRPRTPQFDLPSRSYSLFRSPASYGWGYRERCGATPWTPRGDGIPRRTSCFRMDYAPYELEHDSSKHGPAFYRRHELYPCAECHLHNYHLQRFYKHNY